jgi:hypothetical protein
MADLGCRRAAVWLVGVVGLGGMLAATILPAGAASVPGPPTITNAIGGNTAIALVFAPPANNGGSAITSYTASCTSSNGGASASASASSSPITVNGVTNGRTYSCTVSATSALGTGVPSAAAGPLFPMTVPGAPIIGATTSRNLSLRVAFSAPASDGGSAITSYTASCTSANGGAPGSGSASDSPIVVNGLTNGRTYRCSVRATNASGAGATSALSNPAVPGVTVPDPPTITGSFGGNTALALTFTPPANNGGSVITSYRASCASPDGGADDGSASAAGSPITVNGLTNGRSYTCTVTATSALGTSSPSAASPPAFVATVPGAPVIGTVTSRNLALRVAFAGSASDGGSVILRYTATCMSPDGGTSGAAIGGSSPVIVNGLTNGRTYRCTVTATNSLGTSRSSGTSNEAVPAVTVPDAPLPTVVIANRASLVVDFSGPDDDGGSPVTGYSASCTSSDGGVAGGRSGTASPILVRGLTTGKRYTCRVTASNGFGTSGASAATRPVIVGAPKSPVSVTAKPRPTSTGSVTVRYTARADNGSAVTRFVAICMSSDGGVARGAAHNGPKAKAITVSGLPSGRTYGCWVFAHNARGNGLPSRVTDPFTVGA